MAKDKRGRGLAAGEARIKGDFPLSTADSIEGKMGNVSGQEIGDEAAQPKKPWGCSPT